jgi:hypothetical protein
MEWTIFDQNTTIRALNSEYQAVFWDILSGKTSYFLWIFYHKTLVSFMTIYHKIKVSLFDLPAKQDSGWRLFHIHARSHVTGFRLVVLIGCLLINGCTG